MTSLINDGDVMTSDRVVINRPVFDQLTFNQTFNVGDGVKDVATTSGVVGRRVCTTTALKVVARKSLRFLPVIRHLKEYQWRHWFLNDLMAGVSSGVVHVPQGMGFALLAGLPPAYGLYTSMFPAWIYYLFGTSRHISMGTMALTSLMVGAVVGREVGAHQKILSDNDVTSMEHNVTTMAPLDVGRLMTGWMGGSDVTQISRIDMNTTDTNFRVGVAMSVTLIAGLVQLLMYVCRLGVVATYMSSPFIGGFMTGSAVQIMIAQIPFQLGITFRRPSGMFSMPLAVYEISRNMASANTAALTAAVLSAGFLLLIKEGVNEHFKSKLKIPIPAELILVVIATTVSHVTSLNHRYGMSVIGLIPTGIPAPQIPPFNGNPVGYLGDAMVIAVVAFAISISMAKMMAQRHRYDVDDSQELLAYGLHNVVSSFFGSFVSAQAPPRTLIHETTGAKTQLSGLISTSIPLLVALWIGPLFQSLPIAVLGSIISIALVPLVRQAPGAVRRLWSIDRVDLFVWLSTFVLTTMVSVTVGLVVGMSISIVLVIVRTQLVTGRRLVQAGTTEIYFEQRSTTGESQFTITPNNQTHTSNATGENVQQESCAVVANAVSFRFNAPIHFANAERFRNQLYKKTVNPIELAKSRAKIEKPPVQKIERQVSDTPTSTGCCLRGRTRTGKHVYDLSRCENNLAKQSVCQIKTNSGKSGEKPWSEQELRVKDNKTGSEQEPNVKDNAVENSLLEGVKLNEGSVAVELIEIVVEDQWSNIDTIIIDCSSMNFIDSTGLSAITQIRNSFSAVGIELVLACCAPDLMSTFNAAGLVKDLSQTHADDSSAGLATYPTLIDAILLSRAKQSLKKQVETS